MLNDKRLNSHGFIIGNVSNQSLRNRWSIITIAMMLPLQPAWAECRATIAHLEPVSTQGAYDVFSSSAYPLEQSYRLTIQYEEEPCQALIVLETEHSDQTLTANNDKLSFSWTNSSGSSNGNQYYISVSSNQPTTILTARYPAGQWAESGAYHADLIATLYANKQTLFSPLDELRVEMTASVLPAAQIHYYGTTLRHADVNLGELTEVKTTIAEPRLWIQSTAAYSVSIKSDYKSVLRHESGNTKWDIPYRMWIGKQLISLNTNANQLTNASATQGAIMPLRFENADPGDKPAGVYHDRLDIYITPSMLQQP